VGEKQKTETGPMKVEELRNQTEKKILEEQRISEEAERDEYVLYREYAPKFDRIALNGKFCSEIE
jgi:hypothetical protein